MVHVCILSVCICIHLNAYCAIMRHKVQTAGWAWAGNHGNGLELFDMWRGKEEEGERTRMTLRTVLLITYEVRDWSTYDFLCLYLNRYPLCFGQSHWCFRNPKSGVHLWRLSYWTKCVSVNLGLPQTAFRSSSAHILSVAGSRASVHHSQWHLAVYRYYEGDVLPWK